MRSVKLGALLAAAAVLAPGIALAHPHVFVEPHIEIAATGDGYLKALRNTWRMDEMFSSSVIVDFDANGNGRLDKDELAAVGRQVRGSIERWSFYTNVHEGGVPVTMKASPVLGVTYDDKRSQLVFDFSMTPERLLDLKAGDVAFSNFDDTYFVAFDAKSLSNFTVRNMPKGCRADMSAPSPDEAAKSWMATISAIPADAAVPEDGIKFSEVLSTKFRIRCSRG